MLSQAQVSICHHAVHQISKEVRCHILTWAEILSSILIYFQLAGCNACWVYSFIVCLWFAFFFFFNLINFLLILGWLLKTGYIYFLQPASSRPPPPPTFLSLQPCLRHHHPPHVEQTVVSSKWLFHRPLVLMLFIMLMASSSPSLSGFLTAHSTSLLLSSTT